MFMPQAQEEVIKKGDSVSQSKPGYKAVQQAQQAAPKTYGVPQKKLAQKRQVGANRITTFQQQPVGCHKNEQPKNDARYHTGNHCV